MRELKFRAWVGSENTDFINMPSHYEYDITIVNGEYADVEAGWDIHGTYENVPVEQYTGLKDKNGKEIYEGDIVKFDNYGDEEISEVYFNGACAGYCTHIVDDHDGDYLPFTRGRDVEVIGNIHENGELVETNK